jgi:hypothetical protein
VEKGKARQGIRLKQDKEGIKVMRSKGGVTVAIVIHCYPIIVLVASL